MSMSGFCRSSSSGTRGVKVCASEGAARPVMATANDTPRHHLIIFGRNDIFEQAPLNIAGSLLSFLFDGLPGDIAPAKAVRPLNTIDGLISAPLRVRHRLAGRTDVQHPSAIGEHGTILYDRTRMEN